MMIGNVFTQAKALLYGFGFCSALRVWRAPPISCTR